MQSIFKWLLEKLNLHIDANQKPILIILVIVGLIATYTGPTLTKAIISELPV